MNGRNKISLSRIAIAFAGAVVGAALLGVVVPVLWLFLDPSAGLAFGVMSLFLGSVGFILGGLAGWEQKLAIPQDQE